MKNSLNFGKTKKQPVRSFTGLCKKKRLVISRQHFAANFASKTRNLKFPLFLANCALMFSKCVFGRKAFGSITIHFRMDILRHISIQIMNQGPLLAQPQMWNKFPISIFNEGVTLLFFIFVVAKCLCFYGHIGSLVPSM